MSQQRRKDNSQSDKNKCISLDNLLGTLCRYQFGPTFPQNCIHSLCHRFRKALQTFFIDFVHIGVTQVLQCINCTYMKRISHFSTSQCSNGLRSGDYGSHLSTVNSLSYSRNHFEAYLRSMTWCIILLEEGDG